MASYCSHVLGRSKSAKLASTGHAGLHAPQSISWVRFLEACFGFFSGGMVAGMSDYRHKRHNVSSLIYPSVCPAKYRRVIFDVEVDTVLKDVCLVRLSFSLG